MGKEDQYRLDLLDAADRRAYLEHNSGLPGPRGNLELAYAFASITAEAECWLLLEQDAEPAPENTPGVFLVFCAILGLGKFAAQGKPGILDFLRKMASNPRWRVREAVAMALQIVGKTELNLLLVEMESWCRGSPLEKRAAAAALCEPALLKWPEDANRVLALLDVITQSILNEPERRSEEFRVLRKGLGYCWSVAVAASPEHGKPLMEKWCASPDADIRWIMKENLSKNRLLKMDRQWVFQTTKAMSG